MEVGMMPFNHLYCARGLLGPWEKVKCKGDPWPNGEREVYRHLGIQEGSSITTFWPCSWVPADSTNMPTTLYCQRSPQKRQIPITTSKLVALPYAKTDSEWMAVRSSFSKQMWTPCVIWNSQKDFPARCWIVCATARWPILELTVV